MDPLRKPSEDLQSPDEKSDAAGVSKLVLFSIQNPYFIFVSCLIVIILGSIAGWTLPKDLLPAANLPAIQILSFYPGMPVENVEKNLTARFERYTGQAVGIERQDSRSLLGVSIVRNFFNHQSDLNSATAQTTAMAMSVLSRLPPGTQPPLILPFDPMASIPIGLVTVEGDAPERELYDHARYDVRNAVQSCPGAIAPTVMGGAERQAVIFLDPKKLRHFNLSPMDVIERVSQLNTFVPTGNMKMGNYDYQITSNGIIEDLPAMNNFPIRAENGVTVFLKDVGDARDASRIQTNKVTVDGKKEVYVPVYRQPGSNSFQVVEDVRKSLDRLRAKLPLFTFNFVADQTKYIRRAIESIASETIIGGLLAVLMVFLFLGDPKSSLAIFLSIPLSFLFALIGMKILGQTVNAMTLGGLAVSVGVIVDNSIVVLENINRKLEEGMSAKEAALKGTSEVAMPVLAASLATLVVLFPVVYLAGIAKVLFSALAIAKAIALIGSYLVAMTVMPLFAFYFLGKKRMKLVNPDAKSVRIHAQRLLHWLEVRYEKGLGFAFVNWRWIISGMIVLFVASVLVLPFLGTELFPQADSGSFTLEIRGPTGLRVEETSLLAKKIEAKLREWIDPADLSLIISNSGVAYGYSAAFSPNAGSQDGFFIVELSEKRAHTSQEYAKVIRQKMPEFFPNVEIGIQLGGLMTSALNNGLRAPIDIQVSGPELKTTYELTEKLLPKIKSIKGAVDVRIVQRMNAPQIHLSVDRTESLRMGLTTADVLKNVVSSVSGSASFYPSIWVDPHTGIDYQLGVQLPENTISSIESLKAIPITGSMQNRVIPLSKVVETSMSSGPTEINHENLTSVIDIYLSAQDRDIGSIAKDVESVLVHHEWPLGYRADVHGETAEMQLAIKVLGGGLLLATLLVYLIFAIQFESFVLPAIVLITVPLGLSGVVFTLLLWKTYLSIQAIIGAVLMVGISVANGVLLVEFISKKVKNEPLVTAILSASRARLRPILITALASIIGLLPMALGLGAGSEANIPLGRAVVGGQILSTLLTLFVVPTLYFLISRKKKKDGQLK